MDDYVGYQIKDVFIYISFPDIIYIIHSKVDGCSACHGATISPHFDIGPRMRRKYLTAREVPH